MCVQFSHLDLQLSTSRLQKVQDSAEQCTLTKIISVNCFSEFSCTNFAYCVRKISLFLCHYKSDSLQKLWQNLSPCSVVDWIFGGSNKFSVEAYFKLFPIENTQRLFTESTLPVHCFFSEIKFCRGWFRFWRFPNVGEFSLRSRMKTNKHHELGLLLPVRADWFTFDIWGQFWGWSVNTMASGQAHFLSLPPPFFPALFSLPPTPPPPPPKKWAGSQASHNISMHLHCIRLRVDIDVFDYLKRWAASKSSNRRDSSRPSKIASNSDKS